MGVRPMLLSFEKCLGAMAETVVRREAPEFSDDRHAYAVTRFLLTTHSKMPDYLRCAFYVLTLFFDGWSYPRHGRPFHRLSSDERARQMERWVSSRLAFGRSLITFYWTMATFGLASEIYRQDYDFVPRAR